MTYRITLERNTLRFAAAHFATFGGDCEPLHGHNYGVTLELAGSLTGDSWVLDFSEAKALVRAICRELNHKFILQTESRVLAISRSETAYEIVFGERRYVMPVADVAAVPIDNSTAERLAEWFASRVVADLGRRGVTNVEAVTVGIEEAPGQAGWYSVEVKSGGMQPK
jgi:6-pyruvoyltetrahydropterin/6-carboxytetrahydropterin synthase